MSWTSPRTWVNNEALTAADMNTHIRDNLAALKSPPTAHYELNETSNYTTTSTSFVNVDATNFNLTINTTGGDVLIGFHGTQNNSGNSTNYYDVLLDNITRIGGDDGMMSGVSVGWTTVCLVHLVTGLSAGSHNFKLQWKVQGGTGTIYAGAGTATADTHPQFWVREVS